MALGDPTAGLVLSEQVTSVSEIQRGLGLHRGLPRILRRFASPIARIVSLGDKGTD
jgi:hypothetical protein